MMFMYLPARSQTEKTSNNCWQLKVHNFMALTSTWLEKYLNYFWSDVCMTQVWKTTFSNLKWLQILHSRFFQLSWRVDLKKQAFKKKKKKRLEISSRNFNDFVSNQVQCPMHVSSSHRYTREIPEPAPILSRHVAQIGSLRGFA